MIHLHDHQCDALAGWINIQQINRCSGAARLPHAQAAQGTNFERRDALCGETRLLSLLVPLRLPLLAEAVLLPLPLLAETCL